MSNARSPREVCSTTIGTNGLMVLASFACTPGFLPNVATADRRPVRADYVAAAAAPRGASSASGRPELPAATLRALLAGRPKLLPRLRLLDADRLRLGHEQLDREPFGDVGAQPFELTVLLDSL